ncbi:MAG TPA: CAP domain-containing protein [Pyrinomonadaceae bacterium]|nr:CAP domain-containing protein [Pyrinomonadaceae bacterium]
MKRIVILAFITGLLFSLFLWLRPKIGSRGTPTLPKVAGRPSKPVADGTAGGVVTNTPAASTVGPAVPRPGPAAAAQAGVTHADEIEQEILNLVNEVRARAQRKPLQPDNTLQTTARSHCDDMFLRGYFAHEDPDGVSPADRISEAHRQLIGVTGENIWMGTNIDLSDQKKTAASIMNDWMQSARHRDGILNEKYTHIGIGVALKGHDVKATQNFATIVALTRQAVPLQVHGGDGLDLAAQPLDGNYAPDSFEFFSPEEGMAVGGPRPIAGASVPDRTIVPAGTYRLRFLFPEQKAYWGPQVEVK